jgi:hypothetical protein
MRDGRGDCPFISQIRLASVQPLPLGGHRTRAFFASGRRERGLELNHDQKHHPRPTSHKRKTKSRS